MSRPPNYSAIVFGALLLDLAGAALALLGIVAVFAEPQPERAVVSIHHRVLAGGRAVRWRAEPDEN